MGSGASVSEEISDELIDEVNLITPFLPMAELQNGGIIRLVGFCGLFNVDSLIEPSWLKDQMTLEEYQKSIQFINQKSIESQRKFSRIPSILDMNERELAKGESIREAIEEINRRNKSIRFTYQRGAKQMKIYPVWRKNWRANIVSLCEGPTFVGPESYLYFNLNG